MVSAPLAWTADERAHFDLFADGTYIHWPDLDEDLTVDGIVEGRRSAERAASLKRWLAARKARESGVGLS